VNALAKDDVAEYLNKHFVAAFQKVGTFKIVNGQKQGGNVASYFCTPEGQVLHAIAGPVDNTTLLREARWVDETRKRAALESRGDLIRTQRFFRQAHAERAESEHGQPIDFRKVPPSMTVDNFAMTYLGNGHHGQMTALNNTGKVHVLLAVYPLIKIEHFYKVVFEKVLNEKVSTAPVSVTNLWTK
jgi:hypothetical protein